MCVSMCARADVGLRRRGRRSVCGRGGLPVCVYVCGGVWVRA